MSLKGQVFVEYVALDLEEDRLDIYSGPAWRLCWIDSAPRTMDMYFGRREDAEAALEALVKSGATFQDFVDMPDEGRWKFERIMVEAMKW
jgi:hypothetical protein